MSKKILIIEDSEQDQKILGRMLKKAGYSNLVFVAGGKEGVEKAESEEPALIILDINMPGMPGTDVYNLIKKRPSTQHIPIIYNTNLLKSNEDAAELNMVSKDNPAELLKQIKEKIG